MAQRKSSINTESVNIQLLNRPIAHSFRKSETNTKPTMNSYQTVERPTHNFKIKDFKEFRDTEYDNCTQTDRRISKMSSCSAVKRFKKNIAQKQQPPKHLTEFKENYDIWDLTYTLIQSKMKLWISGFLFFAFLAVRVYTFCCCLYISYNSVHIEWLIPFILIRLMFFILVIKISLNDPATKTQIVLKTHWNSIESNTKEYFEVTSFKKLGTSILRGLIPAELSFLYIRSETLRKKYEIFTAINFIFVSMEEIVFYPFFVIYVGYLVKQKRFQYDVQYEIATIIIIGSQFLIFVILSIYLLLLGIKKKYGSIMYLYNHHRRELRFNRVQYEDIDSENRSIIS